MDHATGVPGIDLTAGQFIALVGDSSDQYADWPPINNDYTVSASCISEHYQEGYFSDGSVLNIDDILNVDVSNGQTECENLPSPALVCASRNMSNNESDGVYPKVTEETSTSSLTISHTLPKEQNTVAYSFGEGSSTPTRQVANHPVSQHYSAETTSIFYMRRMLKTYGKQSKPVFPNLLLE